MPNTVDKLVLKSTFVTITTLGKTHQFLLKLPQNEKGHTFIPQATLDRLIETLRIRPGQLYKIG